MSEYYTCCICGKLIKKDNLLGNYENYVCDECFDKYKKESDNNGI